MATEIEHGRTIFKLRWNEAKEDSFCENKLNHLRAVSKVLSPISDGSLLEIGCGSSFVTAHIAKEKPFCQVIGLDYVSKSLQILTQTSKRALPVMGDAFSLPFKDETIRASWHEGLLEHYPGEWKKILAEQVRVAQKGGLIISSVPNVLNLPREIAMWIQGEKYRYYPARGFFPGKTGSLYGEYLKLGLRIQNVLGWGTTYPARMMYEWDEKTQTKSYPIYSKFFHLAGGLLDKPLDALDQLMNGGVSKWIGFEFMIVGKKE